MQNQELVLCRVMASA